MTIRSKVVAFLAVAASSLAAHAECVHSFTRKLVGRSAEGNALLLHATHTWTGTAVPEGEPSSTTSIRIEVFDIAKRKVIETHSVLGGKDYGGDGKVTPPKAVRKLRQKRWKKIARQLKKAGFEVESTYPQLPKQEGKSVETYGIEPLGAVLEVVVEGEENTESHTDNRRRDLVVRKGAKRHAIAANFNKEGEEASGVAGVYLDPGKANLVVLGKHDCSESAGIWVFPLEPIRRSLGAD